MLPARPLGRVQLPGVKNRELLWRAQRQGGFKRLEAPVPFGSSSQSLRELQLLHREHQNYWETETHTLGSITGPLLEHMPQPFPLHCIMGSGSTTDGIPWHNTPALPSLALHCQAQRSASSHTCCKRQVHCTETQLLPSHPGLPSSRETSCSINVCMWPSRYGPSPQRDSTGCIHRTSVPYLFW